MRNKWIMAGLLACTALTAQAQENKAKESKNEEPRGKAIVQVFANFHTGFGQGKDDRGFDLDRSYLGYEYKFNHGLSVKGVMDIGQSSDVSDYHRIVYIKNALVSWKTGGLTLSGGLISTTQFNYQEKFWGYRYIEKSFQDKYKFGSSADLGISAAYKFADWISADAIIVNGEGYKKIQKKDGLNYGLGVTLTPVKGFSLRFYGGWNECAEEGKSDITNLAAFAGYKHEKFSIGAEYNYIMNSSYKKDHDQSGYSIYASVKLPHKISIYARWDDLYSRNDWNIAKDEGAAMLGAEFKLGKYVKVAPNFRLAVPRAEDAKTQTSAYVNCYFGI